MKYRKLHLCSWRSGSWFLFEKPCYAELNILNNYSESVFHLDCIKSQFGLEYYNVFQGIKASLNPSRMAHFGIKA